MRTNYRNKLRAVLLLISISVYFLGPFSTHPVFAEENIRRTPPPGYSQQALLAAKAKATHAKKMAAAAAEDSSYRVQPGDRLEITVYREEDLSKVYEVDPNGKLNFPLIGGIEVKDLSIEQLRNKLTENLKKFITDPQISISRSEGTIKSISVLGYVQKPGVYDYTPNSTLMRMISTAGGFKDGANKKKIKVVRIIKGKKEVIVINAKKIISGNADDPKIQPSDIIFVPESIF
ncbi:MAG: hypothetical protein A3C35_08440 [Omnitrophica bacterium RIFCSPHIGHO2_02_FULL_46_11]|nr:MAG: hypothetical protein A3C35_08440 [Omnitrophica bacterium RIFCSPHIGHO2_02_FULL_46_11]OGW87820.1 MAG: hypothetical protein A3A81_01885 [Omnitrophica bacterium RIFCSPLOWO2_01_FULL_45_10b]